MVFTANHMTVTDKPTINKKTEYKLQKDTNKHTAETKLPWVVASYDLSQETRWSYSTDAPSPTRNAYLGKSML